MKGLHVAAAGMTVLAVGSWLAMAVNVHRGTGVWIAPWHLAALLEEYGALKDLGRAPALWPALLLLAGIGLGVCWLLFVMPG